MAKKSAQDRYYELKIKQMTTKPSKPKPVKEPKPTRTEPGTASAHNPNL